MIPWPYLPFPDARGSRPVFQDLPGLTRVFRGYSTSSPASYTLTVTGLPREIRNSPFRYLLWSCTRECLVKYSWIVSRNDICCVRNAFSYSFTSRARVRHSSSGISQWQCPCFPGRDTLRHLNLPPGSRMRRSMYG